MSVAAIAAPPPCPVPLPVSAPSLKRFRDICIRTAPVFHPLLFPCPWKGAYGGRGSGKTEFFAELAVDEALRFPGETGEGLRLVGIREVLKDLSQSSKLSIEDKIRGHGLGEADGFKIFKDRIELPKDGLIIFKGMNNMNANSAKSLKGFQRAWIDEAQDFSKHSLHLLGPTIHRHPGSEIWASWNPFNKDDAIDAFFRDPKNDPKEILAVMANWRDNPFWNESSERSRLTELRKFPERYAHTYEGEYAGVFEGAYFAELLTKAKLDGRIGSFPIDELLPVRAYVDIGGESRKSDAFVFWIVQFVQGDIIVLNHYEKNGQKLADHVAWLRKNGYENAEVVLPHDGANLGGPAGSWEDHFRNAGFQTRVIKNKGAGAAMFRVEAVRRIGPRLKFNAATTEDGRTLLGLYHAKIDPRLRVDKGPEHDFSSHSADAFGLMAIDYEDPSRSAAFNRQIRYPKQGYA